MPFLLELFLYSGQYGLFYLLMSGVRIGFFDALTEWSHIALFMALVFQCWILAKKWSAPSVRFFGSLILPVVYSCVEYLESPAGLLDMSHAFFWMFSLLVGSVHAYALWRKTLVSRLFAEMSISFVNVLVSVFTYFYMDLAIDWARANVSPEELANRLSIQSFAWSVQVFFHDQVHVYFILSAFVLALAIGLARSRILYLQDRISAMLGTYVDPSVRNRIMERKPQDGCFSEKRSVAILFSDIRSFTSMSEKEAAEDVVAFLNRYFSIWDTSVRVHGGWIDKFIGDAVMVVFDLGSPEKNAVAAWESAREVLTKLPALRKGIFANGDIWIGIHVGEVIMGDIGSESRRNFTVIGDPVNVASRLEWACKEFWTRLVMSEESYAACGTPEGFERAGPISLKGKTGEHHAYRLIG